MWVHGFLHNIHLNQYFDIFRLIRAEKGQQVVHDILRAAEKYFILRSEFSFHQEDCGQEFQSADPEQNLRILIVGMGGGGLTLFVHRHLCASLEVVELDPAVVDAAQKWFDLKEDIDLTVSVGDGIETIHNLSTTVGIQPN